MVNAIIFVHDGKMFVIGMDTERPVYYPLTMTELKGLLEDTKIKKDNLIETWETVSAPLEEEVKL
jgi:tRNA threonylcarbamoyladenosine modification (KEOPS) complex Cgi121 subunit